VCSLFGSSRRALVKTGQLVVSIVCLILCFSERVPLPSPMIAGKAARRVPIVGEMEQSEAANLERGLSAMHLAADWVNLWGDRKSKLSLYFEKAASRKETKKRAGRKRGSGNFSILATWSLAAS